MLPRAFPIARRVLIGLTLIIALQPFVAAAQPLGADIKDATDHPLISRFVGSQLIGAQSQAFEAGQFFLPRKEAGFDPGKELDTSQTVRAEGKVTRRLYVAPVGKSVLEVHRNFEQALKGAGLTVVSAVNGKGAWWGPDTHWLANFSAMNFLPPWASDISPMDRGDAMYVYGTLQHAGAKASVSVLTAPASLMARSGYKVKEGVPLTIVAIQVIEPTAMASGQVVVQADALQKGLEADGKVALYGIYFDSGKAMVKPESAAQLAQMAEVLRKAPELRVHIVGHTDNAGSFESNLALSQLRAASVVAALTGAHKIDTKRLAARGAASMAPVMTNQSEAGRAKNRRVEMVVQ